MRKQTEKLQCNRATKMIPSFIADELSFRELEQFMEHIDECESCKEELSIQFLVEVGLNSLEAGNTFDLQQELNIALEEAAKRVQVYRFFRHSAFVLACVGIAAAIRRCFFFIFSDKEMQTAQGAEINFSQAVLSLRSA